MSSGILDSGISQKKFTEKIFERVSQAHQEGNRRVVIYFNKPDSRKIRRNNEVIYHSKVKVTRQQVEEFVQLYYNDCMVFRWNHGGECLLVDFVMSTSAVTSNARPRRRQQTTRQQVPESDPTSMHWSMSVPQPQEQSMLTQVSTATTQPRHALVTTNEVAEVESSESPATTEPGIVRTPNITSENAWWFMGIPNPNNAENFACDQMVPAVVTQTGYPTGDATPPIPLKALPSKI